MRAAAPPVAVEVRRLGAWRAGVGVVSLAAMAVIGDWMARGGSVGAGSALLAIVAACGLSLGRQRQYSLGWDGAVWRLNTGHDEDSPEGRIDVVIDLGGWMLLRWQGRALAAPRWLPVGAGDAGPRWRALRAAAHGQPSEASPAVVDR